MRYHSTRGRAPRLSFDEVLLAGLAEDGGLYLPESWPTFSVKEQERLARLNYPDLALEIFRPFVGDAIPEAKLAEIVRDTYAAFGHPAIAPLKQLEAGLWLMELFHGPTLAFKDFALQLVGRLFDYVLAERGERIVIVGATSGDTGSAAIEACRGRDRIEIFILHPEGRVSEVQRRQMTTVAARNVHNIALQGTFDDCQDQVKALFHDQAFRAEQRLSAVNSINWARIMAQIAYYFWAGLALGASRRPVAFSVPSGNFGNIFAGYAAKQMGLDVSHFVVGTNANDILTRFFTSGSMTMAGVEPTYSPSMDIQVSSNFERLLFSVLECDGAAVASTLQGFRETGHFSIAPEKLAELRELFTAHRVDDEETLEEMKRIYQETGELIDPHSAIGIAAARAERRESDGPMIALATAHPAKFPDAVEKATGIRPSLPDHLSDLLVREESFQTLPNDTALLKEIIRGRNGGDTAKLAS